MKQPRLRAHSPLLPAAILISSIVLFTLPARAQTTDGPIPGAVTDPSGAPIAAAPVTLTNLGTSERRTQATGNDGLYLFVNLLPARYSISVEKSGFKRYTRP